MTKVELGRATWTFLHTLAAQVCLNFLLWRFEYDFDIINQLTTT